MSEKEKSKPAPYYRQFIFPILFAMLSIFGAIIVLVLIGPLFSGRILKTSLDPQYIATAEYLLENPMPNPERFPFEIVIWDLTNDGSICLSGFPIPMTDSFNGIQIYFDKTAIWGMSYAIMGGALSCETGETCINYADAVCIDGTVESGLHILTLHLNHEIYGGEYTHEWAIEIP